VPGDLPLPRRRRRFRFAFSPGACYRSPSGGDQIVKSHPHAEAGIETMSGRRDAIIPAPDRFQRDVIRMIATLFGPMIVGAILIPLLMIIFSLLGYSY
jgi:hypothetical protein